jgi:hypothetical protein
MGIALISLYTDAIGVCWIGLGEHLSISRERVGEVLLDATWKVQGINSKCLREHTRDDIGTPLLGAITARGADITR